MLLNCGVGFESPLDCKKIQAVHPKGNLSWIFIGRTDAEAETPILWLPDAKNWLTGKDSDAGKDWRQEEKKRITEDEMVGWYHQLEGYEFGQAPGVGDGQGSPVCCSPCCKESDTTEQLKWTDVFFIYSSYKCLNKYMVCIHFVCVFELAFHFCNGILRKTKVFKCDEVQCVSLLSLVVLVSHLRNYCLSQDHESWFLVFSVGDFIVLALTFRTIRCFQLIFVYDMTCGSSFILLHVDIQLFGQHLLKR